MARCKVSIPQFAWSVVILIGGLTATAMAQAPSVPFELSPTYLSADPMTNGEPPTPVHHDDYESVTAPKGWRFLVGLPIWVPGLNANLSVDGFNFSTDQDANDVIDNIDSHINFAAALHVEVQHDRIGAFGDFMYLSVAANRDTVIGTTQEGDVAGFIGELGLLYTLVSHRPTDGHGAPFRVDLIGGMRATSVEVEIDTELAGSGSGSKTLWDPFIGLRGEVGLLRWLSIKARGDVGGFDAFGADSSQFTWQASAAASFHLARWCNFDAGYRCLSYEYDDGDGLDRFELDALLHGPYIEFDVKF